MLNLLLAEIDLTHTRIARDLLSRALTEERTIHKNRNRFGETEDEMHVMLDQDKCNMLRQARNDFEDLLAL
jgi:fructose-1,6-bisphosphatase